MAAPIGPGDWVECVFSTNPGSIRVGRIFQCERVKPTPACQARHGPCGGIWLVGDPDPYPSGWALCCYRPIYRPKQEIIESLKAPPALVGEPA